MPLRHLTVVDLAAGPGMLAVRLFSGFGARVIRVVPPNGDPAWAEPTMTPGADGQPISIYGLHMLHGREPVVLDLAKEAGRSGFRSLLAEADVVVESQEPGYLATLGIDYAQLAGRFPALIWTSITPFGRTGPRAAWAGTDLIGMAAGGLLSLCGDPDRPPLRVSVEQAYAQAGAAAAVATMIALRARERSGAGQLVDVSVQEAVANCLGNARLVYEFEGLVSRRAGGSRAYGAHGARLVYPCADGHVAMSRTPASIHPLHRWMSDWGHTPAFDPDEWAALPQSGPGTPGPEKARELEDSVIAFFAGRTKAELYAEGQRRGLLICPVSTPRDLLENPQLRARRFFQPRYVPELGRDVDAPGPPVRLPASPWSDTPAAGSRPRRSPPAVSGVLREARDIFAPAPGRPRLRIADFSWVGVGPISTQLMAFLGAEVIRIESAERLDVFRSSGPKRGADPDASAYFANCNRDKLGMTLNLKRPGARQVALDLVAKSDVLVESFTPGFLASVGLAYEDVRAANPSIIMMSCSMEGGWGPHAQYRGFGLTLQSAAGITHFTRWPDRAPVGTGVAYTDWFATNIAALALLIALDHRDRTGEGQYIDLSQLEACMWALDAELFRVAADGSERPPLGNRHPTMVPHGVFPCRGNDAWIAIAIRNDRDWSALASIVDEAWCRAPGFATVDGRRAAEDTLEALLTAWTASREADELAEVLQSAGVPAYPVRDMAGVSHDPQLNARGHFWEIRHPVIGPARWDAPAYRLSGTPITPGAPAPLLGEHNDYVYRELLGYSDDAIAALIAAGVME